MTAEACFDLLGIEPTDDGEKIKKAYRDKLPQYHPEEDPEGFQKLRQAYDGAMKYKPEAAKALTPADLWVEKVGQLYKDYGSRINTKGWQALLEEDICISLDTAAEVSAKLLDYLMQHYCIPHEVWRLLSDHFSWEEKQQELCEIFPPNFINYVLSNAKYQDYFRYHGFGQLQDGKDYEKFILNYFYVLNNLNDPAEEIQAEIRQRVDENTGSGISHPDFTILRVRYELKEKNYDQAWELAEGLLKSHYDTGSIYCAAQVMLARGEFEKAAGYAKELLAMEPEHASSIVVLAEAAKGLGNTEEALDYIKKARKLSPSDFYILQYERVIYDAIYEKYLQKQDGNEILFMEAAVNTGHNQEAAETGERIGSRLAGVDPGQYYKNYGIALGELKRPQEAVDCYEKALACAFENQEDPADIYANMAIELINLDRGQDAMAFFEKGMALYPDSKRLVYRKAAALNMLKRYKEAVACCDLLLEKEPVPNAYHFKAEALYHLGEYDQALENCDAAIRYIPYYTTFILKLCIFNKTGQFDRMVELADYLKGLNLDNSEIKTHRLKALVAMQKYDEAKALGDEILMDEEFDKAEAIYELALVKYRQDDEKGALEMLQQAKGAFTGDAEFQLFYAFLLEANQQYTEGLEIYNALLEQQDANKADLYMKMGNLCYTAKWHDKAEAYYAQVLALDPSHPHVNGKLADVYDDKDEVQKAIDYNTKQLAIGPSDYYYIQRGILQEKLGDFDGAIDYFHKAAQYNPSNYFSYNNIGLCYIKKGEPEKAVAHYEKAIELGYPYSVAYINLGLSLQRLGRYEEAVGVFNQGMEKFQQYKATFLFRLGFLHYNCESFQAAIDCYRQYSAISGYEAEGLMRIGHCYRAWRKKAEAVQYFKNAHRADRDNYEPLEELGITYEEFDQFRLAAYYYKKAVGKGEAGGFTYLGLGRCFRMLNKKDKSKAYYEKALQLFQKELEEDEEAVACHYTHMGTAYAGMGEEQKALECFHKAFAMAKYYKYCHRMECFDAHFELGEMYNDNGEYEKALESYQSAKIASGKQEYDRYIKKMEEHLKSN